MRYNRKMRTLLGTVLAAFGIIWFGRAMAGADYSGAPYAEALPPRLIDISFPTPPPESPDPTAPPSPTFESASEPAPLPELPDISPDAWELAVVDALHPLDDYSFDSELVEGQSVDARIAPSLRAMLYGLRKTGCTAFLSSAWRSSELQNALYLRAEEKHGENAALYEDRPGESEHQTGLCCDITDIFYEEKTAALDSTDTLKWLAAHCSEYGFIIRYPAGKEDVTAHPYEPWHFRYVGNDAANYISAHGITLEEFILLLEAG